MKHSYTSADANYRLNFRAVFHLDFRVSLSRVRIVAPERGEQRTHFYIRMFVFRLAIRPKVKMRHNFFFNTRAGKYLLYVCKYYRLPPAARLVRFVT